jgi:hypothetical protein
VSSAIRQAMVVMSLCTLRRVRKIQCLLMGIMHRLWCLCFLFSSNPSDLFLREQLCCVLKVPTRTLLVYFAHYGKVRLLQGYRHLFPEIGSITHWLCNHYLISILLDAIVRAPTTFGGAAGCGLWHVGRGFVVWLIIQGFQACSLSAGPTRRHAA